MTLPSHRLCAVGLLGAVVCANAGTSIVSLNGNEAEANGLTRFPVLSDDLRWIAFSSDATNLVANDNNNATDIFVRDLLTGAVTRVSVRDDGTEGNGASGHTFHTRGHAMSDDARWIAFFSAANNLDPTDTNPGLDLFLHDRDPDADGIFDEGNGTTRLITRAFDGAAADGPSGPHGIEVTDDGRWIVFYSEADNLVADDFNGFGDCFIYDRISDSITRMSVGAAGEEGDRAALHPTISPDGRYLSYYHLSDLLSPLDNNGVADIYFVDRDTDENGTFDDTTWLVELVSISSTGVQGNAQSRFSWHSEDGRFVAFESNATTLVDNDNNNDRDIFVRDRHLDETHRVSVRSDGSEASRGGRYPFMMTPDGTSIVFRSPASDLVDDDVNTTQDVFIHDLPTGTTTKVSETHDQGGINNEAQWMWISNDSRLIAYESPATNITPAGTNGTWHCYVHDRGPVGLAGDVNRDGAVNFADLNVVLARWALPGPGGDADGSGTVDFGDLNAVLNDWGAVAR